MIDGKKEWHESLGLLPTNLKDFYTRPTPGVAFDPRLTTQETLLRSGFPRRPDPKSDAETYRKWSDLYGRALNYVEPQLRIMDRRLHGSLRESPSEGVPTNSDNWAGKWVSAAPGKFFTGVSGSWEVPEVSQPSAGPYVNAGIWVSSAWVGLDGASVSNDIFQAGTEHNLSSGIFGRSEPDYYAWTEWYPVALVEISNFPVAPTNKVTVVLKVLNLGNLFGLQFPVGQALMINQTRGNFTFVAMGGPLIFPGGAQNPAQFVGDTAEWIVETPCLSDCIGSQPVYGPLPHLSAIAFDSAHAWDNDGNSVDGVNGNVVYMTNSGTGVGRTDAGAPGTVVAVCYNPLEVISIF